MGLLDLPSPLFAWIDGRLFGGLAPLARLSLWALAISAVSLALYTALSPQRALRRLKAEMRAARQELRAFEGEFNGVMALARRNIALSIRQVWLVAPAALAACVPVIMLVVWLARAYGTAAPTSGLPLRLDMRGGTAIISISEPAAASTTPDGVAGRGTPVLHVADKSGEEVFRADLTPALTRLDKRHWWHWLHGNAAGYLPPDAPVETIRIYWPQREILSLGPAWLRGWETPFFALAVVFTLGIQAAFRIE